MNWIQLYRQNKNYSHLLKANLISLFGDWFNFVALTTVLFEISDNKAMIAYVLIIHLIPFILFTPIAGIMADKISRRKIMMISDLMRFLIVLGYFPAIYYEAPMMILLLLFIQYIFATLFEPARSAIIPDIVSKEELFAANSALAAVWSMMMALGMSIGGIVVYLTNVEIALFIDALTYLISYLYLRKMVIKEEHLQHDASLTIRDFFKLDDYLETIRYLKQQSFMIPVVFSKGILEIYTGAFIYFLTLYGEMDFKILGSAALSIGLLQAARGIGTGIGPILSRKITKTKRDDYLILPFWLLLIPTAYLFLSYQTLFGTAILFVLIAHIGGGANWVVSENLIHQIVPNRIRGRIISFEYLIFTLIMTVSIKIGAIMIEDYQISLKQSTEWVAFIGIGVSIIWGCVTYIFYQRSFPNSLKKSP